MYLEELVRFRGEYDGLVMMFHTNARMNGLPLPSVQTFKYDEWVRFMSESQ